MSDLTLVIGNKASSSWSLRPWLALKQIGVPFDEITIPLRQPETKAEILRYSPAGKVPVLIDGDLTVYDSLAILEYLAEIYPDAGLWPDDRGARAVARSIAAEMHSGFVDLRRNMPMDVTDKHPQEGRTPESLADIARITQLWRDAKARFGADGPFLFGRFSAADAMYAPVCTRLDTYCVELDEVSQAYVSTVLGLPAMREWYAAGAAEPWGALL
jgi:glutathione S-transferase